MYDFFAEALTEFGMTKYVASSSYAVMALIILAVCVVIQTILNFIVTKLVKGTSKRTTLKWGDILLRKKVFRRLSYLVFPIVMNAFTDSFPKNGKSWSKLVEILSTVIAILVFDAIINAIDEIYSTYEVSRVKPIRGLLQIAKAIMFIVGGVILVSQLISKSPLVLLSGIGAMTAVSTLIFKDAILGFVAGIQLNSNDMVHIGDWIEVPDHSANGTVVDLSLTTVKVENFDQTITTLPAYSLVSESFINWRGMQNSGARQIKRSIYIDATRIKPCDKEMLERLSKIRLLKEHIENKLIDIANYNALHDYDSSTPVNGRRLTNIGLFRAYMLAYVSQHPGIKKDMTLVVRQLNSTGTGIPLQVYAFANTIAFPDYEMVQSDIFDHFYSIVEEFELSIFQQPTGDDIRKRLIQTEDNS